MKRARRLTFFIDEAHAGKDVKTLLRQELHLSGAVLRRVKWLEDGILLDGVRVNTRCLAQQGQTLSVRLTDPAVKSGMLPRQGRLDLVYEDADLVVVNKAPGVAVHPGPGHYDDTLGNYLMWHYAQTGDPSDYHPVHRLDKGTSGLMVVAKHPHSQEQLKQQLHTGAFRRVYLAVCEGVPSPPEGLIDLPIGPDTSSLIRRQVCPDGAPSRTRYLVREVCHGRALMELTLDTGRTHQIRVHMAHIGHPLTGDFLYGTEDLDLISRPALHSATLDLLHPITHQPLHFSVPLPADMTALMTPGNSPQP